MTLESDEEIKEGEKNLTPNKLFTRLPILLAQIKDGNNSNKLKYGIRQILYLLYPYNKITKKSLQQFNQVITIMEESMIVIRNPKIFCFKFGWPKYVDESLNHENEFIIKNNESFGANKINKETE